MNILGIDPGITTGWAVYDSVNRRCIAVGRFLSYHVPEDVRIRSRLAICVIERLRPHGASYPQVVESSYVCGRIVGMLGDETRPVHELRRDDVRRELQLATFGSVQVSDDATVWAALRQIHGDGCTSKGGALHALKSADAEHERAALAVAVAWALRAKVVAK